MQNLSVKMEEEVVFKGVAMEEIEDFIIAVDMVAVDHTMGTATLGTMIDGVVLLETGETIQLAEETNLDSK